MPSWFDSRVLFMALFVALSSAMPSRVASADSLRCNGMVIDEGQSQSQVALNCGAPMVTMTRCVPPSLAGVPGAVQPAYPGVYGTPPVPNVITPYGHPAYAAPACVPVEEWIYDRGQGHLHATAFFLNGTLVRVRYGRN